MGGFTVSLHNISLLSFSQQEIDAAGLSEEVSAACRKYLDRADVVLLSKLTCKKTGKSMTVCNIHVVYDPKAPDVQCVQVCRSVVS